MSYNTASNTPSAKDNMSEGESHINNNGDSKLVDGVKDESGATGVDGMENEVAQTGSSCITVPSPPTGTAVVEATITTNTGLPLVYEGNDGPQRPDDLSNLTNENIWPYLEENCPDAGSHMEGEPCRRCRGFGMPYGENDVPFATDDHSNYVLIGEPGALLAGMRLTNDQSVATMIFVAYLDSIGRQYSSFDGLLDIMNRHPEAVGAGQRVANLFHAIRRATGTNQPVSLIRIIERAQMNPHFTPEELWEDLTRGFRSELDPNPNARLRFEQRPNLSGSDWNAPPPSAEWEFVPGTDLSNAVLFKPEPHKFFLVRQRKHEPEEKDCRQYPNWAKHDWNDKNDIEKLNKHRAQIRHRTMGLIADPRLPWTEKEKDELKGIVEGFLRQGQNRKTINWNTVAENLQGAFQNVLQKKGEPLAQRTKLDGSTVLPPKFKRAKELKKDRFGPVDRKGSTIKIQAQKFGDIRLALRNSLPFANEAKKKRQRGANAKKQVQNDSDLDSLEDEQPDSEPESEEERPKKKAKRGPATPTPRGPKKPPGPPPAPGTGQQVTV